MSNLTPIFSAAAGETPVLADQFAKEWRSSLPPQPAAAAAVLKQTQGRVQPEPPASR